MNLDGIELCCPRCRGQLGQPSTDELVCRSCGHRYPVVLGIPDLRVFPDPYIGFEEERRKVGKLVERYGEVDFEGFVDYYYSITSVVTAKHARQYKRGLLAGEARARAWVETWKPRAGSEASGREALLEVGCGTAPLLAVAESFPRRVGVDIALRWLVVGKKRLEQAGLKIPLLAACAEALPFADGAFAHVAAESTLEHVTDQRKALAEVYRALQPGGTLRITTPNRWSIGPDPQTGIWCGSFLPRAWTDVIVRRQGGIPPKRRLLTARKLRALLRDAGFEALQITLPGIPQGQRQHFSPVLRGAMTAYDLARRLPVSRHVLFLVGPMLQAGCRKPAG